MEDLGVILQELIETFIRERVVKQHIHYLEWHGSDVGSGQRGVDDVRGRA